MTEQLSEQLLTSSYYASTQNDRALLYSLHETILTLGAVVAELDARLAAVEPQGDEEAAP